MKTSLLVVIAAFASMLSIKSTPAAESPGTATNSSSDVAEANYTKAIEGRTADILKELSLTDPAVTSRIHDAVMAQYRALRAWHDENDTALKAARSDTNRTAQIQATLKVVHDRFLAKLAADLTPEQVDKVKDKMTYGVVQVTFNAYAKMYPDLTDAEKKQIMAWLIEAREIAMDQGSSDEKHAVFGKYKGRINNYLSRQGYDAKTGRKKIAPAETPSPAANPPAK